MSVLTMVSTMEPQRYTRRVYNNAEIDGTYLVASMKFAEFEPNDKFRTYLVENLSQYESGCHMHSQCFGHMCRTPADIILPPQSMSMRTMEIATEYYAAAKLAFTEKRNEYIDKLRTTNYTKEGTMRCTMSTPVAGSCRLIASPQYEFGKDRIAISKNLASRMSVCRNEYGEHGEIRGTYIETSLQEGDWVIAVRPPSLHLGNTQPLRVVFWDADCAGVHPETFSAFHGDFDGDEIQQYPVYNKGSIQECEAWEILPLQNFVDGRRMYNKMLQQMKQRDTSNMTEDEKSELESQLMSMEAHCEEHRAIFLEYSTLSSKQLKEGGHKLYFGDLSRSKSVHVDGMYKRFNDRSTEKSFVSESIRGTDDIKRQQLSQGTIGDATRISKIVASCFYRPPEGGLYIAARHGTKRIQDDNVKDTGTPAFRAMANLCASLQQSALNAHRAEAQDVVSHDFVSDLILGCKRKTIVSPTSDYTFMKLKKGTPDMILSLVRNKIFTYDPSIGPYMLCDPHNIGKSVFKYIEAAYDPTLLAGVAECNGDVRGVCMKGIIGACNYNKIRMSRIELTDVTEVFIHMPEAHKSPITTRDGLFPRQLGWIETLLATDYTKLPRLAGDFEIPHTSTAATLMSNFNNLTMKDNSDEYI